MSRSRVAYGDGHAQAGDMWRPPGATGDLPVVVLIHGGFWKFRYTKLLMNGLARAVTEQGWAAWNIEYRRVGGLSGGGWPDTFADVAAAIDHLAVVDGVDLARVVTCGHSAGGQLALWAAARGGFASPAPGGPERVAVRGAMALAGVSDLESGARLGLGGGAVTALMGGDPESRPDRYRLGSPAARQPIGRPQVLIHGLADTVVPPQMSQDYQQAGAAAGDDVRYVPLAAVDHRDLIDAHGPARQPILAQLAWLISP